MGAFAELIHAKMCKELWGYAPDEKFDHEDLLKVKYQGIRPAPGYPTQPDHTEKNFMWKILEADKSAGISLTESLAMLPAASSPPSSSPTSARPTSRSARSART